MTTRDVYKDIGDFDRMISCISNEESIRNFLRMFLEDDNFSIMESALNENDSQKAFYGAHTLKGSCQNLCLTRLYSVDYDITEALRIGDLEKARKIFPRVREEYEKVVGRITSMDM